MPDKFNELLLKQDIIELYNAGITPDYGYLLNGRFEKDMIKTLYLLKTLSGNPISWEASDTEYLFPIVSLEPKQAGTGDPSPENVRAISGYDSVTVTQSKDEAQVKQITLTLPETIYGGTVDAVTGVGEKTWTLVEFDGTEDWYQIDENGYFLGGVIDIGPGGNRESVSNIAVNSRQHIAPILDGQFNTWSFVDHRGWCAFSLSFADSLDSWKSYLAAQAAAGTPVQVAYKLATPEPFQATGNQPLTSLLGYNTIYTNGDSITLNRKASPSH